MKTISEIDMAGKRVLVRVDFNVPLAEDGTITDDARIKAALPTLEYILQQGAALMVASHLGRPKGKRVAAFSLEPVAGRLEKLLNRPVRLAPDCIGEAVQTLADNLKGGDVLLLENLRFHPQEGSNDDGFGAALAALCDVYVNDAFAVCHRENASVAAVTRHVPVKAAGFLLKKELDHFRKALLDPVRPLIAVVGGSKVSDKLATLENLIQRVDKLVVGGAMANTFLSAKGIRVGRSLVERDLEQTAAAIEAAAFKKGVHFYLPVDAVSATAPAADAETLNVPVQEIPDDGMILDIGPATSLLYALVLKGAGTVVWNGPMGMFELAPFRAGTVAIARALGASSAMTIVGGGDTGSAVQQAGEAERVTYISTGGGAFLTLLEGKPLPAVTALEDD